MVIDYRIKPPNYDQGIYKMPYDQYASIPALRSSDMKHLKRTPAHFRAALEIPRQPPTPQQQRVFDIGKAFDIYVLDGGLDALNKNSAIEPETFDGKKTNRATKVYKQWRAAQGNKLILSIDMFETAVAMAQAAFEKKTFSAFFKSGYPHKVLLWCDPVTGLWCKAEIDWLTEQGDVVDLKSTASADFWFFSRNAWRLGYFNQGAHYLSGLQVITEYDHDQFYLAAVEKDPPYESQFFKVPVRMIDKAMCENEERRRTIAACLRSGDWPGYPDYVVDIETGQYDWDDFDDNPLEVVEVGENGRF